MSIARWIERHAAYAPTKTAIAFEGRDLSYAELARDIDRLAWALAHVLKIRHGDRVAILVPLNWRLAPPEHAFILRDAGIAALFCEAAFRDGIEAIAGDLPAGVRRVGYGFAGDGWYGCEALLAAETPPCAPAGTLGDPALIVYTSGTTGRPKGAVLTQGALLWNAINSTAMHDLVSTDRVLTFLPMFHVGGLNIQTLPALHAGATVLLQARFHPGEALAAIGRWRPSLTLLVPAVMKAMIDHPAWRETDLSSLRLAGAGSSIVPVDLIRAFHQRGVPICQIYGSTETAPIAVVLRREDAMRKEGSTGTPALHCEARIVDDRGRDVRRGERGEIVVRGPNVMAGYWRDAETTASRLAEGWFHTGDIGHQDEDGFFWVDERKSDVIISGGENIYPAELESILADCPALADGAVVARPDPKWGEVPVAVVVRKAGATIDEAGVHALFAGRIARFKHPHDVVFVAALPRNVMGKVLRYQLRDMVRRPPSSRPGGAAGLEPDSRAGAN